jgi:hypothetical protein
MERCKLPRWLTLRFSLRTLFVLVTVASLSAWWVTTQLTWVRHRRAADAQHGYSEFVSIVVREKLHQTESKELTWGLRLFGEEAVPVLHCHPASELKAAELRKLFPEADVIEIYYPSFPDGTSH